MANGYSISQWGIFEVPDNEMASNILSFRTHFEKMDDMLPCHVMFPGRYEITPRSRSVRLDRGYTP